MTYKHFITITATCLALAACNTEAIDQTTNERPKAQEGEFCGGIAAFECVEGFVCVYDGDYPDAGGTCEAKQED